jgi:glycosyltransferase involved in cell wall biosynthesis
LSLRRNLGHQRAIAIGLSYIQQNLKGDAVIVMDADGEDRPEDLPKLVEAMKKAGVPTAVFAERGKRLENVLFRGFYQCYRILHRIFIGRDIRFGNFSVLPWSHLESLVVFPELWNHYAAAFLNSRLPYQRVRMDRGARLRGRSRMNFVSLLVHGLSAVFANQEVVGTRLLVLILLATMSFFIAIAVTVGMGFFLHLTIPGWAIISMGFLLVLIGQALTASFVLVFSIMMNRSQLGFLPVRDYSYFVRGEVVLFPQ